jgi:uncharacterized Ntn-hydrolase superfamily protein
MSRNRNAFFKLTATVSWIAAALPGWAVGGGVDAGTFSIVAYDAGAGEWGVGVASKVLAAGYVVPWAKAGVGAVATQSYANLDYGVDGLELLAEGLSAEEALERLREKDAEAGRRQVAMVDAAGNVAVFTGEDTLAWSGHIAGEGYSVQGNILVGEKVLTEMERAYVAAEGPLARRLLAALKAGEAAGGDKRGKESAALLVVRAAGGYQGKTDRMVDIRVDDHAEPVAELERIYDLWEQRFLAERYLELGGEREAAYALAIMGRVTAEGRDQEAISGGSARVRAPRARACAGRRQRYGHRRRGVLRGRRERESGRVGEGSARGGPGERVLRRAVGEVRGGGGKR